MANTDPDTGQNGFEHQFQVHEFIQIGCTICSWDMPMYSLIITHN